MNPIFNNQPFSSFNNSSPFQNQPEDSHSFPPQASLPKLTFNELLPLSQNISKNFSSPLTTSLSDKISSINSLRSIYKSFPNFFFQIFIPIKCKFIQNILTNKSNLHIQLIAIKFLQELFSEQIENLFPDNFIFDIFPILFDMYLNEGNEFLKGESKKWIETFSKNTISNEKYACLIRAMKGSTQETAAFLYDCVNSALEEDKKNFSYNFCLNDIMNYIILEKDKDYDDLDDILDIKNQDSDYFMKIQTLFQLINKSLDSENQRESISGLSEKNKNIYHTLIN